MARKDRVGENKGLLTIVEMTGVANNGQSIWKARCECGKFKEGIRWHNWNRFGDDASCGCLREKKRDEESLLKKRAESKKCSSCKETKPRSEFHRASKSADGLQTFCIACNKSRYERDSWKNRGVRIKSKYGITLEQYDQMLLDQGNKCANPGCSNTSDSYLYPLHIDHDHSCCEKKSCGKCVRGLLCHGCNIALGSLRDDIDRIRGLADYLMDRV